MMVAERHDMQSYELAVGIIVDCSCGWRRQMPLGDRLTRASRITAAMREHLDAVKPRPKRPQLVIVRSDDS